MITLTTPPSVMSVLGGTTEVSYDRLVLSPIMFDVLGQTITGSVQITSSANPNMAPIMGSFSIRVPGAVLEIQVERLDFYRRVLLTSPQTTAVLAIITNAQDALEQGLISLGVISGTHSSGA